MCLRIWQYHGPCLIHPQQTIQHCPTWQQCHQLESTGSHPLPQQCRWTRQQCRPCIAPSTSAPATTSTPTPAPAPATLRTQPPASSTAQPLPSQAEMLATIQRYSTQLSARDFGGWLHAYLLHDQEQRAGLLGGPTTRAEAKMRAAGLETQYWLRVASTDRRRFEEAPGWIREENPARCFVCAARRQAEGNAASLNPPQRPAGQLPPVDPASRQYEIYRRLQNMTPRGFGMWLHAYLQADARSRIGWPSGTNTQEEAATEAEELEGQTWQALITQRRLKLEDAPSWVKEWLEED
ncbi:hypothetical protein CAC42_7844 [Sphaceloma murrayae]|uniref:Uncharacterized protein n=1 Tax=Sphaceloma murrayae TaxID=2082308 RepID=A0A2K1QXW8_9PEZI|nr:hypothetical protein CAC42_7844 [Sphaceloma murrayae]